MEVGPAGDDLKRLPEAPASGAIAWMLFTHMRQASPAEPAAED